MRELFVYIVLRVDTGLQSDSGTNRFARDVAKLLAFEPTAACFPGLKPTHQMAVTRFFMGVDATHMVSKYEIER